MKVKIIERSFSRRLVLRFIRNERTRLDLGLNRFFSGRCLGYERLRVTIYNIATTNDYQMQGFISK